MFDKNTFSKIKHATHPNPSVTTGNYAKTKCFPFCISTIQYKSLRFEATEGVNKGFLRCRSAPHEYAENL